MAVASTGPASTGIPVASSVRRLSKRLLHGPGQQGVHLLYPHQVTLCQRLQHATHIFALRDRHFRSPGPAIVRNGLFHISRMLEIRCIDIYGRNICCLLCLGYQEIVTGTPPSLVNPARRASSVNTGSSKATPSNDHVPELRKALTASFPLRNGTACTALAVS